MLVRRTAWLHKDLDSRLENYTKLANVRVSEVIRKALGEYLAGHAKRGRQKLTYGEKLRRSGLIGCIEDAQPDLSTNPRHIKSLGGMIRTRGT